MDERLEKALEFSNYQATLQVQKDNLKIRLNHALLLRYSNSVFKTNLKLINFIQTCINQELEEIVIEDLNGNPVKIDDLKEALKIFLNTHQQAYKEYEKSYSELKKARNIKKVVS